MNTPVIASSASRPLALWLLFVAAMVFAMAIIGAITRLTESGLSMVEWRPIIGVLPPLNDGEWQRVFALYQQTPEFRAHNFWMDATQFKTIFWWEWGHRLWAHLLALSYVVPLILFWVRGQVTGWLRPRLLLLLALGLLQGVVGGVMVASGLVDEPRVSPYKLALHLGLALILFSGLWLTALRLLDPRRRGEYPPEHRPGSITHGRVTLILLAVTIVWGALVAGLDAGRIYTSWPLMEGDVLPPEASALEPFMRNFTENPALVQFIHRWLGVLAGLALLAYAMMLKKQLQQPDVQRAAAVLAALAILQPLLGIVTLKLAVPLWAGALHQAGAIALLAALLTCRHRSQRTEESR